MKRVTGIILIAAMMLSACSVKVSSKPEETSGAQEATEDVQEEPVIALSEPEESEPEAEAAPEESEEPASSDVTLPPYEYPGPELFYTVLYQYLHDAFDADYPDADVAIPCPVIIAEDESNKDDIRVWGNFWYFKYDLNGDVLECNSGGSYPGLIHVKSTDEGYEVTGMEIVSDGSDFDKSAKEIFGEHYDTFMKDGEDNDKREELRAQIIANYVFANDLPITAYKDYGWDPVSLPEENIDNFYSILD